MAHIVVIGGTGFFGRHVVERLKRAGHEVAIAGRPPAHGLRTVVCDLTDARTFGNLEPFDVIVNLADGVEAPADALVTWAIRNGCRYVECSAFAPFYRRTLQRDLSEASQFGATVVLGAGVFPGMSTALALEAAEELGEPDEVEVSVRLSPLSGAGWASCLMMARMMALPGYEWVDGARVERPSVGKTNEVDFPSGAYGAAVVDLPDVELIRAATGASNVRTRLALTPGVVLSLFRWGAAVVRWSGPLRRPLLALTHWLLALLRGLVWRDRATPVEVTVTARSRTGEVRRDRIWDDGREATAEGVAMGVDRALSESGMLIGVDGRRS